MRLRLLLISWALAGVALTTSLLCPPRARPR